MIVIGNSNSNIIVTMSKGEFANLMNLHSSYALKDNHTNVGFEYDISEVYSQLRELKNNKERFEKIRDYLGKIQSSLKLVAPYVEQITEDKEIKEINNG